MEVLKRIVLLTLLLGIGMSSFSQSKGKLFVIGGGERSAELIKSLVHTADLKGDDYIVILPMATSEPEESIAAIAQQLGRFTKAKITAFNFSRPQANTHEEWIDSVRHARLIYVTGGDQNKFMNIVRGTQVYDAMHLAYDAGATIAGTSAGAAIMSEIMITGEQVEQSNTVQTISKNNIFTTTGMGFMKSAIIDQHFIIRSRYNRMISVLLDNPTKMLIGVDEGTAIIVRGQDVQVVGNSQVVVLKKPINIQVNKRKKVSFEDASLSLYTAGEYFKLEK